MSARAPRGRTLAPLLLLSALLHGLLGLWLWSTEERAPTGSPRAPEPLVVDLWVRDTPAVPPAPPETRPPPPRPVPRTERRPKKAGPPVAKSPPVPPAPSAPVEQPPEPPAAGTEDAPQVADVPPRRPSLLPSWMQQAPAATGSLAVAPESRGRTLRPGDPELRPESAEETSERLTAQVQGWADDDTAGMRAQGMGAHPYLGGMRGSFEVALGKTEGGKPRELGIDNPLAGLMKNYTEAAEEYGRTGSPGITPPSTVPLHSEQLAARLRDERRAQSMIASAQALETVSALESRGALLTVKLELRHSRTGALLGSRLTQSSGNRLFDAFVLKVVPASMGTLEPPPPEVLRHRDELKTGWLVEGWHRPPKWMSQAIASSLASGQLAIPLTQLIPSGQKDEPEFEYRVRLSKLY